VTGDVRAVVADLVRNNAHKLQTWLDVVGRKNPAKAVELFVRLLEYNRPRLARTEFVAEPTGPKAPMEMTDEELKAEVQEILRKLRPLAQTTSGAETLPAE